MTTVDERVADGEQRIMRLSKAIYGDPDAVFETIGYPVTPDDCRQFLRVLHRIRNNVEDVDPVDAVLDGKLRDRLPNGVVATKALLAIDRDEALPEIPADEVVPVDDPPPVVYDEPAESSRDIATADTKRCSRCKTVKPIDEFGIARANPDGHNYTCKECIRAISKADRAASKARAEAARNNARSSEIEQPETLPVVDDPTPASTKPARDTARSGSATSGTSHSRTITWDEVNTITLTTDVRILLASSEERKWLMNVIDAFDRLEEAVTRG